MRIYYDTEFIDDGHTIDLISIGMVREDGRELYAVSSEFNQTALHRNPWLVENVWSSLPIRKNPPGIRGIDKLDLDHPDVRTRAQIARLVEDFILGPDHHTSDELPYVELWAYYSAYDHVALAQLWGPMMNLPEGIPMQSDDIITAAKLAGLTPKSLPKQQAGQHNALADARHNAVMARYIDAYAGRTTLA
jgi:hypothetical protein